MVRVLMGNRHLWWEVLTARTEQKLLNTMPLWVDRRGDVTGLAASKTDGHREGRWASRRDGSK